MKNYLPSQVAEAYAPDLQVAAMSAFPTILSAKAAKNTPAIKHLAEAYDEPFAVEWIRKQLFAVNMFAGVKSKLTDMQLDELSIQIRLEYGYLTLFEFILFCARLRSGKYEDFYGSVDPMRILKSLDSFCQNRREELAKEQQRLDEIQKRKDEEETQRNKVTFDAWYLGLSEDEKAQVRDTPYFGRRAKEIDEHVANSANSITS